MLSTAVLTPSGVSSLYLIGRAGLARPFFFEVGQADSRAEKRQISVMTCCTADMTFGRGGDAHSGLASIHLCVVLVAAYCVDSDQGVFGDDCHSG